MNFDPFVRRLSIRTKQQTIEQFHPNWAQTQLLQKVNEQYSKGRPIRIIVLKARQLGISTVSEALMFAWVMLHQQTYGLVIAHEIDASEYLLNMTKLYWETFPFKNLYTTKYVSRKELAWEETGSSIRIATAKNMRAGRSRTINAMHGSEIAFWDRPDEMMLGLRQTIPNTAKSMIILESTANGVGNWYYDTWQAATANETDFEPLFFPWWEHPDYTASAANLKRELLSDLDSDERVLKKIGVDANETFFRRVELVLQFLLVFFALWALTVHGLVFLEGSFRSLLLVFPIVLSLALLGLSLFRFAPLSALGRNRGASDDGDPDPNAREITANFEFRAAPRFCSYLSSDDIAVTV